MVIWNHSFQFGTTWHNFEPFRTELQKKITISQKDKIKDNIDHSVWNRKKKQNKIIRAQENPYMKLFSNIKTHAHFQNQTNLYHKGIFSKCPSYLSPVLNLNLGKFSCIAEEPPMPFEEFIFTFQSNFHLHEGWWFNALYRIGLGEVVKNPGSNLNVIPTLLFRCSKRFEHIY